MRVARDSGEDEFGNLLRQYPIQDDPELMEPMPSLETLGLSDVWIPAEGGRPRRRRRPSIGTRGQCGNYGGRGRNRRTCTLEPGERAPIEEEVLEPAREEMPEPLEDATQGVEEIESQATENENIPPVIVRVPEVLATPFP